MTTPLSTTPLSLLQRAKQGDAVAIAVLMNDVLEAQNVWVKATLDSDCLQVMLKAPTVLHQAHCIAFIRRGLLRLQPKAINQVIAYAWRVGDAFPLWIAAFSLEQTPVPQRQCNSRANAAIERSTATYASVQSDDTPAARHQPAPLSNASNAAWQRSELFKFGFVIVLTTVVYFMVAGV